MTRTITSIAIHCAATPNGRTLFSGTPGTRQHSTPVDEINRWHLQRGFKRAPAAVAKMNPRLCCIGYHYVIYTNGAIATGRSEAEVGAHAAGYNAKSVAVCLVGTDRFAPEQWAALADLVRGLQKRYPQARVLGHRDYPNVAKSCPGFDVQTWLDGGMVALAGHVLDTRRPDGLGTRAA